MKLPDGDIDFERNDIIASFAPARASSQRRKLFLSLLTGTLIVSWPFFPSNLNLGLNLSRPASPTLPKGPIDWAPCGEGYECGRLEVPLDYHNPTLGTASLSVGRYLATSKEPKLGSLLVNPGGPGGGGVNFIYRAGKQISDVLEGRYDIVSWDPRGINQTTPRIECFANQTDQDVFFVHTEQESPLESRNLSSPVDRAVFTAQVRQVNARAAALAELCQERTGEALKHVGTATVVRDLELLSRALEGDAPVNFWGFSYGTVIGSYFVNMFPDRVGRIAIDGVVDPVTWSSTPAYTWGKDDFVDTERAYHNFLTACANAGPKRCALATDSSTAKSIRKDIDALISDLYEHPLPVPTAKRPGILTSGMVRGLIFAAMYKPRGWPALASQLAAAVHKKDGKLILDAMQDDVEVGTKPATTAVAINAVTCVDTPVPKNLDFDTAVEDIVDEIVQALEVAPHFGAIETSFMCHHWKARETERFTGPFNATLSNDILVIGNTADPITPVVNARAVAGLLSNSRLIVQDGSGHCSLAMASLCTGKAVAAYFLNNTLPERGLVCPTEERLFPDPDAQDVWMAEQLVGVAAEDVRLLEAWRNLGRAAEDDIHRFKKPRFLA
ncbi:hypothetical protein BOTBODRAFT_26373 [Botryobasidium botryosum FD-172 SS1]|uniref:AB hydrolase-1 domain-containing protein n=1 Tax=Botryobasidium botryosum (strain FD-172 SS1) TaxID=930990 RepID=A0A067N8E9_BOTB1|nr:hypothetical protein BOTBODRAFT_26373 [Botryobasidium botryosum FD-172 SS1]